MAHFRSEDRVRVRCQSLHCVNAFVIYSPVTGVCSLFHMHYFGLGMGIMSGEEFNIKE